MKKILLLFAAAICAVASWAADEVTATITGKQIAVNLANETSFCAFQMDVALPAGVGVDDVALNVGRLDEGTTTVVGAENGNFQIRYNVLSDGTLRVIAYNLANRQINNAEGTLFTVTLDSETSEAISIDNILFVDTATLIEHRLNRADVEEGADTLIGDINGDGKVNLFDLDDLIDYQLGYLTADDINIDAADVNGDTKVNLFDIDDLIDLLLGY